MNKQKQRTARTRMIGAHVADRKKTHDHLSTLAADCRRGVAHFWRKRGGQPQEFHGSFSK